MIMMGIDKVYGFKEKSILLIEYLRCFFVLNVKTSCIRQRVKIS